jgi:hypothetical protein
MKILISSLAVFLCLTFGYVQVATKRTGTAAPNLTGAWDLNKEKSDLRDDRDELRTSEIGLTISNNEPELRVTRRFPLANFSFVYYTDGRGETNSAMKGHDLIKSKTAWNGKKLISKYTVRRIVDGRWQTVGAVDEWTLSDDGSTLTLNTLLYRLSDVSAERSGGFRTVRPIQGPEKVPVPVSPGAQVPESLRIYVTKVYDRSP